MLEPAAQSFVIRLDRNEAFVDQVLEVPILQQWPMVTRKRTRPQVCMVARSHIDRAQ